MANLTHLIIKKVECEYHFRRVCLCASEIYCPSLMHFVENLRPLLIYPNPNHSNPTVFPRIAILRWEELARCFYFTTANSFLLAVLKLNCQIAKYSRVSNLWLLFPCINCGSKNKNLQKCRLTNLSVILTQPKPSKRRRNHRSRQVKM